MSRTVRAVYEHGVFRPVEPVPEFPENATVLLTVRKPLDREALDKLAGTLSAEDAAELERTTRELRRVEGEW